MADIHFKLPTSRHAGVLLAGVVVHGCTVNESKDEIHFLSRHTGMILAGIHGSKSHAFTGQHQPETIGRTLNMDTGQNHAGMTKPPSFPCSREWL